MLVDMFAMAAHDPDLCMSASQLPSHIRPEYLYSSHSFVQVIKSRRMRWAGHVARRGRGDAYTGFRWGNLRERDHLEDSGIDGRIILRWIFRKWDVDVGLD